MQTRLQAITRQRSIRMMALMPVVIASALVIAGCGDKSKHEGKASQAAARVNGEEITVHQINQLLERQQGLKPEQAEAASRQALEGLIDQQLAVAKAEDQKLDRDPQIVALLDATRRSILARAYVEKAAAAGAGTPSSDEVRKYFDSKPALFAQRKVYALQEFTVPAAGDVAKDLMAKLKATKTANEFAEVLKASGVKFTANQSTQAAESLPLGIIEPLSKVGDGEALYITAKDGFKALLVVASKSQPVTFDQAKPAIEQYLTVERRREFAQKELKSLRAAAKIEYIGKFAEKAASGAAAAASEASPVAAPAASEAASGGLDANALSKGLSGLK
ncbi:MAG TPA: EpsD family peptidyl-prolyl cis-trans isomerase [Aquabacterium sp.]|uniref:EpsD family peptidyl-prolyl cis-trans isomerase n=1 Tax=Aquabacterium sp. TaxID=1872578 RepID=UPI002E3568B9|nr:EpsD family peptidyl-prolyl cis-trans isomerase [Aquabacterium sp.]HEX5355214.1 EpsD family peptidyl-prolyl cis-trans isomerase [Aquabacterium sp.]